MGRQAGRGVFGRVWTCLDEEERLQQEVEQHVSDDFADAGEGMGLPARDFERQVGDVLERGREGLGGTGFLRNTKPQKEAGGIEIPTKVDLEGQKIPKRNWGFSQNLTPSCSCPPGLHPEAVFGGISALSEPSRGNSRPGLQAERGGTVPDLEPDGVDDLAEHEEGKDPERAEHGGEEELQPGPDVAVQRGVTCSGAGGCEGTPWAGARAARDTPHLPMICAVTDWRTGMKTR